MLPTSLAARIVVCRRCGNFQFFSLSLSCICLYSDRKWFRDWVDEGGSELVLFRPGPEKLRPSRAGLGLSPGFSRWKNTLVKPELRRSVRCEWTTSILGSDWLSGTPDALCYLYWRRFHYIYHASFAGAKYQGMFVPGAPFVMFTLHLCRFRHT